MSGWVPWLFSPYGLEIGPIPKGTPVGLLANVPFVSEGTGLRERVDQSKKLLRLGKKAARDLKALPDNATPAQKERALADLIDPLLELSKCPDYVVNRGHYFGTNLSDTDKVALIEFLKTF